MDNDIIAYFYPHDIRAKKVVEAIEANSRYAPPLLQSTKDRGERESTEPPENVGAPAVDYLPRLVVRFSDVPRTDKGLVFGSSPNCDVVLKISGMSNIHFSLTFDDHQRPIIKDLNSLVGTEVTYNKKGKGARRDFRWIVSGHQFFEENKTIIITVPGTASFQIVVQEHDITAPAYINAVACFKQGSATADDLLDDLGLSNPPTRPRSGAHTPGTGAIRLQKNLGEGSFGVVTYFWDVSTGEDCVIKTPSLKAIQKRQVDRDAWRREIRIMSQVSHDHIVKLINWFMDPQPELHLEYMPCGSLEKYSDITYNETFTIVRQCLSALAYLHEQETPIAHRDLKPANILVESRSKDAILVKLGDFGLSRPGSELTTLCGTYAYLAPEVHLEGQRRARHRKRLSYTVAVDIWSLGVVACELLYKLPLFENKYRGDGVAWCKRIVERLQRKVQNQPTAMGSVLLERMVVLHSESRQCARDCFNTLEHLLSTEGGSLQDLTASSYPEQEGQTTVRYAQQNSEDDDLATAVRQPRLQGATTSPYSVASRAPPPESPSSLSRLVPQYQEFQEPPAIRQYSNWQQGHQQEHFPQGYSTPLGGDNPQDWIDQFLQYPESSHAGATGQQAGGPSIPQDDGGEWTMPSRARIDQGGNVMGADEYEEMLKIELSRHNDITRACHKSSEKY